MINGIKPIVGNTTKTQKVNGKNGLSFDEAMDTYLLKYKRIIRIGVDTQKIRYLIYL